ncbi:carbon-nitrogen hydrolase family protein [Rhodococcus sp. NPDC003382]|uniref:carbon-nitrogen hydrolase family protein n=1 Tax=unclassified Rhodococcus (in: high G+C Gram-positive bacteria) TaxID=192944 RepID=UPI00200ABE16|nr:carbon-nitrogen hydrolase family protein [Rhodococcus sp. HM1]MCK8675312.1 carbon-nitrogen hydrolase family protein [Rhodococcus sp. HM1]
MNDTLQIALCQIASTGDPDRNLATVRAEVGHAARAGARVVVFPEATMAHFGTELGAVAEPIDGPWACAVAAIADEHDVLVVAGMFTPDGARVRNTVIITGLGQHFGYDKIHLYDAFGYRESDTVAPGSECVTVTVDGLVLGVATCYDIRFPALFQRLAEDGASAVLVPTSWGAGDGKADQWDVLVRARALDSGCWVLGCDQADPRTAGVAVRPDAPTGIGRSLVADPSGAVVARLGAESGMLLAGIDGAASIAARRRTGVLANRSRTVY